MDAEEEREMRLAAQARAGAEWALAALIARYQPPVLRYLARLTGNPAQAHRLAERIFVRMERRLRGPRGAEHLRLWLLRAATEAGLDALRHPGRSRQPSRLNAPNAPRGLLMDGPTGAATDRLRAGLSRIAEITGTTRRQVRQLIWNSDAPATSKVSPRGQATSADTASRPAADIPPTVDPDLDAMNPQEELRHRLVRAVLAELPYGDAQCLALHLVAGLNQTEVARALGIRPSAARHRIVQGLQMFSHRYEAAVTSLGVPAEVAYAPAENLLAPVADAVDTVDVVDAHDVPYAPSAPPPYAEQFAYVDGAAASSEDDGVVSNIPAGATSGTESATYEAVFPEVYGDEDSADYDGGYDGGYGYDQDQVVAARVVAATVSDAHTNVAPVIVDALPATPVASMTPAPPADGAIPVGVQDELPDGYWLDQPTMVPVLSTEPSVGHETQTGVDAPATPDAPDARDIPSRNSVETAPRVPVVTPPNQP
jgi:RNA polymerase sigma factor (sigma-70 family)